MNLMEDIIVMIILTDDASWFDKNKEKYLKTENEEETIFDL